MPYEAYEIEIEDDGEFDVQFTRYANESHRGTARLIKRLEAFARNRRRGGEFLRGSASRSVFVVPSRETLDGDGEAGLLALVNDGSKSITPMRLLRPRREHRWEDHVKWAEALLGI